MARCAGFAAIAPSLVGALLVLASLGCSSPEESPSDSLQVDCEVVEWPSDLGSATLDLWLRDAQGERVTLARVDVEASMTHPGMVPERERATEVEAGRYRTVLELRMRGDWFMVVEVALHDGRRIERVLPLPRVGRA